VPATAPNTSKGKTFYVLPLSLSVASDLFLMLVVALYLSLWVIPFLIGFLIALGIVRYREWLAILAVAGSMVALAGSGDFLYNLRSGPQEYKSRPPLLHARLEPLSIG
jgi:hypothetical protein